MHSPLEQYLEQVETRLRELPAEKRQSEMEEMRQHLQDSVSAHVELGCSPEEAVVQTLEQFGQAQQVGAELAHAHERNETGWRGSLLSAVACAYAFGLSFSLLRNWLLPSLFFFTGSNGGPVLYASWWLAQVVMVSLLTGWVTALFFPRKAVQGTALAYIISCGFSSIVASFHSAIPSSVPLDMRVRLFAQSVILALIAMLIAMLSAKMGVMWKKARQRRRRLA